MAPKSKGTKNRSEWSLCQKSGIFYHSSDSGALSSVLNTSSSPADEPSFPHIIGLTFRSPLNACHRTNLSTKLSEHDVNAGVYLPLAVLQSLEIGFGCYVTVSGSGFHLVLRAFPHSLPDWNGLACTQGSWLQLTHTQGSLTVEKFTETISAVQQIYLKTSDSEEVDHSDSFQRQIKSFLNGKVLYNAIAIPYRFFGKRLTLSVSKNEDLASLFTGFNDLSISNHLTSTPCKRKEEKSYYFMISPTTKIEFLPKNKEEKVENIKVGGLCKQEKLLIESIQSIFSNTSRRSVNGILLYGPPGVGKTLLSLSMKTKITSHFRLLAGPELYSKFYGETEFKIREIFAEAERLAPSILVIDELDCLAPRRDAEGGDQEKRVATTLQTCLDKIHLQQSR